MIENKTIKILVVEDEVLLLRNIRKKITAISEDFEVIGEAFNGKEALGIIEHIHPDIVLTDIRMPIMDGLELTRILHEDYPEIYTVIISGHNDFEYARTVLTYRVYDYLLKPVQNNELEKLLYSLRALICNNKKSQTYTLLYNQLKESTAPSSPVPSDMDLENSLFSIFLICLGNLQSPKQKNNSDPVLQNEWKCLSENLFLRNLPFTDLNYWVFPFQSKNMKLFLVENLPGSSQETATRLHDVMKNCVPHLCVNLAYSIEATSFTQLYSSADMLYKLLSASLVIGQSALFALPAAPNLLPPAVLPVNFINYIQTLISSNNAAGFEVAVGNLFEELEKNQFPQQWIEKLLLQLLHIIQQNLYFSDEEYDEMYRNVFHILETEPTLSSVSEKTVAELLHWIVLYQSIPSEIEETIEELYNFIHSHYTESINLAELAEKYHFNQSYLTRIFKKQKGEAPLKLINTLRINDAKRLLLRPELSVREISEMLGFSNQHYFSRIFKEFTARSPKEYRMEGDKL